MTSLDLVVREDIHPAVTVAVIVAVIDLPLGDLEKVSNSIFLFSPVGDMKVLTSLDLGVREDIHPAVTVAVIVAVIEKDLPPWDLEKVGNSTFLFSPVGDMKVLTSLDLNVREDIHPAVTVAVIVAVIVIDLPPWDLEKVGNSTFLFSPVGDMKVLTSLDLGVREDIHPGDVEKVSYSIFLFSPVGEMNIL